MTRITTLYATHGYATSTTSPTWVILYRDRAARHCVTMIPADSPTAPMRNHHTVNLTYVNRHCAVVTTSYALEWLD